MAVERTLILAKPDAVARSLAGEIVARFERRLEAGPELTCWVCNAEVQPEFLVCPVCTTRLRQACEECGSPLEPIWQVCPYCATPVPPGVVTGEEVLQPVRLRRTRRAD